MKLSLLGKSRKGKKSFNLISVDEFGYNIQCTDKAGTVIFNNVLDIKWLFEGEKVYINPNPIKSKNEYDFTRYDKVKIMKAKVKETENFVSLLGN